VAGCKAPQVVAGMIVAVGEQVHDRGVDAGLSG
jgi:hypothetical protein